MRVLLINKAEQIVYKTNVADLTEARAFMRQKCLQDNATYWLAVLVRKGTFTAPPPVPDVTDEAL